MQNQKIIRLAEHAGSWYNKNAVKLAEQMQQNLAKVQTKKEFSQKSIKAIIGPHAGFKYSGPVAAWAYKYFEKHKDKKLRVFLLGPSHYKSLEGVSLSNCTDLQTPVGNIQVDTDTLLQLRGLIKSVNFTKKDEEKEHSLQMHMPYLRQVFGQNIKVVPIIVGRINMKTSQELGKILSHYFDDQNTVFVISSDFCHWGDHFDFQPYKKGSEIWQYIKTLDNDGMNLIEKHDLNGFFKYIEDTGNTICGQNPIKLLLSTILNSKNKLETSFVQYDQSQKVKQFDQSSVSYASSITYIKN